MLISQFLLRKIEHDTIEYLASNTMNILTKKLNPLIWTYDQKALITEINSESEEVISITLLPNQFWNKAKAGQYIELNIEIDGIEYKRCYSISKVYENNIVITIKKIINGKVSNWIHNNLKKGMILNISGPWGDFTYRNQKELLFITAGVGITPAFSIVNDLIKEKTIPKITFYTQFSSIDQIIFLDEMNQWGNKINLNISITKKNESSSNIKKGKLNKENFSTIFPNWQNSSIYLCGPDGFMEEVIYFLSKNNFDFNNLYIEKFTLKKVQDSDKSFLPEVFFKQYNKKIKLQDKDRSKTLLQIGLENNLNLEKGCQKGFCGTCKLILHDGKVVGNKIGNVVYLCTAYPDSETVVLGT